MRELFIFKYKPGEIQQRKRLLDLAHSPDWPTVTEREKMTMKEKEIERNKTDKIHEEADKWKGIVHPKMKFQNHLHTIPNTVLNPCDILSSVEHKIKNIFKNLLIVLFHATAINRDWSFQSSKKYTKASHNYHQKVHATHAQCFAWWSTHNLSLPLQLDHRDNLNSWTIHFLLTDSHIRFAQKNN